MNSLYIQQPDPSYLWTTYPNQSQTPFANFDPYVYDTTKYFPTYGSAGTDSFFYDSKNFNQPALPLFESLLQIQGTSEKLRDPRGDTGARAPIARTKEHNGKPEVAGPVGWSFSEVPQLQWKDFVQTLGNSTLKSPLFFWEELKEHPYVSASLFAGLVTASATGILNTPLPFLPGTIGDGFLLGGSLLATGMIGKALYQSWQAFQNDHKEKLQEHSRDFGIGLFSLAMIGLTFGLLEFTSLGQQTHTTTATKNTLFNENFFKGLVSVLHSSDEIAVGIYSMKEITKFFQKT